MFNAFDNLCLRRCFDLAQLGKGQTSPNPSVGSVITYEKRVIGEGWHKKYGQAHAEVNAFASIQSEDKQNVTEAQIYVSLEPCFHYGKTAPCVNLLLNNKISKAVIAFRDPNPLVGGQSIEKLQLNSIPVAIEPIPSDVILRGYRKTLLPFFTAIQRQRPHIILKWAETADGYMGLKTQPIQISNKLSKRLVHKWRNECDGILVGAQTAETDDPGLDNRYYYGKSPIRIVLDPNKRLAADLQLFDGKIKTLVYSSNISGLLDAAYSKKYNVFIKNLDNNNSWINDVLQGLYAEKIHILLVEGGAKTLGTFIQHNLWDEVRIIKSTTPITAYSESEREWIAAPKISFQHLIEQQQLVDNTILKFHNSIFK